jgi:hypothetical protein
MLLWIYASTPSYDFVAYIFFLYLHAVVFETCACGANCIRYLQGECSNLAPVSGFSWLAQYSLKYFLPQKDPVECILLTNSEITDETETQIPGYLW